MLDWELEQESDAGSECLDLDETLQDVNKKPIGVHSFGSGLSSMELEKPCRSFKHKVLNSLQRAVNQAENDFLYVVEQEMEDRPDLVSVGCCVLLVLLHGKDMYVLNLGDSRAVLATYNEGGRTYDNNGLQAVQLTVSHTVDNECEKTLLLNGHPDDPSPIVAGKIKGKLKVTRALGVGYLKRKIMNDALMGILKVRNLISPPYVSVQPSLTVHEISSADHFVILGSDGLFDFFTNDEVVKLARSYILNKCFW
nr:probable protein phosphatase 2C 40 [Ipomoea batatas]